jgi:predicted molibdopterin-dependent oxidoreductase YjgC
MSSTNLHGVRAVISVCITVDGVSIQVADGVPLAAGLLAAGIARLRSSPRLGAARGAFCFMGSCQECVVTVDGARAQACLVPVRAGMVVGLGGSAAT